MVEEIYYSFFLMYQHVVFLFLIKK